MRFFKTISDLFILVIISPFIIAIIVLLSPIALILIIINKVESIKDKKRLKALLKIKNGQIYFLYSNYNDYDFQDYFKKEYPEIECLNTSNLHGKNILLEHLIENRCTTHAFPRLVKISNDRVITKLHFGSLKHFYKRKNNIKTFFEIIEKSIENLKK